MKYLIISLLSVSSLFGCPDCGGTCGEAEFDLQVFRERLIPPVVEISEDTISVTEFTDELMTERGQKQFCSFLKRTKVITSNDDVHFGKDLIIIKDRNACLKKNPKAGVTEMCQENCSSGAYFAAFICGGLGNYPCKTVCMSVVEVLRRRCSYCCEYTDSYYINDFLDCCVPLDYFKFSPCDCEGVWDDL